MTNTTKAAEAPPESVKGEVERKRDSTLLALINQMKPEIARALPKHMSPDRLARIATTVVRQTPDLQKCEAQSFLGALMTCAQLGLEPGPLGHAYFVPFKNTDRGTVECTFILGYRGMLELARRSGQIESCAAHVVRDGDQFDYALGLNSRLDHVPASTGAGDLTHVYAVVHYKDGGHDFEVMNKAQVDKIRDRSKSKNGPWKTDYDEMARKTVLRRLAKRMPMSIEYAQADGQDEQVRTDIDPDALDVTPPDVLDGEVVSEGTDES